MFILFYFRKNRAVAMVPLTAKKLVFDFKNACISDVDLTMSQPNPKPGNRPPNTVAKRFPNPASYHKFCIAEPFVLRNSAIPLTLTVKLTLQKTATFLRRCCTFLKALAAPPQFVTDPHFNAQSLLVLKKGKLLLLGSTYTKYH